MRRNLLLYTSLKSNHPRDEMPMHTFESAIQVVERYESILGDGGGVGGGGEKIVQHSRT